MTGVIFDRCTFINCSFNAPLDAVQTNTITFRVCSFLDMESTLEKNTDQKFEQCIFQAGLHKNDGLEKKQNLESQIGKLLI